MSDFFTSHRDFLISQTALILSSYQHWLGKPLLVVSEDPEQPARDLLAVSRIVLSAGPEEDPILNFANQATLNLWEMDWDTLCQTPSRLTAEPMHRAERAAFLEQVRTHGFVDNYQGIRISKSGKRFRIEKATVWNLIDSKGTFRGQAASFVDYTPIG